MRALMYLKSITNSPITLPNLKKNAWNMQLLGFTRCRKMIWSSHSLYGSRAYMGQRKIIFWHNLSSVKDGYLCEIMPPILNSHCNPGCYRTLYCRTDLFWNSFLPFSINEWNKLEPDIRNLDSQVMLRKKLLTFIRLLKITFTIFMNHKDLNFLTGWG